MLVEPLGVGDPPRFAVHRVGAEAIEQRPGVRTGHLELRHERHVEQPHALAHGAVLGLPLLPEVGAAPGELGFRGDDPSAGEPVGALPSGDVLEPRALRGHALVQRRALHPPRRAHRAPWVVALVDHSQALDGARRPVARRGLVGVQAVDVHPGDVDVRRSRGDPVRDRPTPPAAGEDADRVQPGGNEVVAHLGRLPDHRQQVRRERLGTAEERVDPRVQGRGHPAHRGLDVGPHPVPVRRDGPEREVLGDPTDVPRRADRLEQPDHQAVALGSDVGEVARVLQDGPVRVDLRHRPGDQVVVLGGLQRDAHPRALAELTGPHARGVDHVLALDVAGGRAHADDRAVAGQHVDRGSSLEQSRPAHARALGQGHRDVDGVHSPVGGRVERREDVVGAGGREQLADLPGADLVHVDAAVPVEGRDPPVLLEAAFVGRDLDQPDRPEARRLPGLGLEPGVQVLGVHAQLGRGLRGRAERDHQPGGVPGRPGREAVALEQHRVGPAQLGQVVGDRRADDPAADHDHARPSGEAGGAGDGGRGSGDGVGGGGPATAGCLIGRHSHDSNDPDAAVTRHGIHPGPRRGAA